MSTFKERPKNAGEDAGVAGRRPALRKASRRARKRRGCNTKEHFQVVEDLGISEEPLDVARLGAERRGVSQTIYGFRTAVRNIARGQHAFRPYQLTALESGDAAGPKYSYTELR
jgi:hypothetical protein